MSALLPGANWFTLDRLEPDTNKLHRSIYQVLTTSNFSHLQNVALVARGAQFATSGSATLHTESFTFGMNNLVFKITFSDGVIWIARVCYSLRPDDKGGYEDRKNMLSEIATLRTLRQRTTIPVPDVFAFEAAASNDFGYPYMLMECLAGKTLSSATARHVPLEHHPHVAKQLASVLFQLQNLSFDKLGRIWCGESGNEPPEIIPHEILEAEPSPPTTSLEWFYKQRQDQNRKVISAHAQDPEWRTACWVLKSAVSHIIIEDRVHGPFPLCHLDLHYGNLLFDDDYNLTGVLDWSGAGTAPLEILADSPEFITPPGKTKEENQVIIDFRDAVRNSLRELDAQSAPSTPLPTHKTTLAAILGTRRADIIHRCATNSPQRALWYGRLVAKLIYKDAVTWDQLVAVYGESDVY